MKVGKRRVRYRVNKKRMAKFILSVAGMALVLFALNHGKNVMSAKSSLSDAGKKIESQVQSANKGAEIETEEEDYKNIKILYYFPEAGKGGVTESAKVEMKKLAHSTADKYSAEEVNRALFVKYTGKEVINNVVNYKIDQSVFEEKDYAYGSIKELKGKDVLFNTALKKEFKAADMFKSDADVMPVIIQRIKEGIIATEKIPVQDTAEIAYWDYPADLSGASVSESGLVFPLEDKEYGIKSITVPYDKMANILRPEYLNAESKKYSAEKVSTESTGKRVALTFDDGPHGTRTPETLDVLEKYDAKATFFVQGKNVISYPEVVKQTVDEGHEIANHTWNHPTLSTVGQDEVHRQILNTEAAIYQASGEFSSCFRPPYGDINASAAEAAGLPAIMWSLDTLDWQSRNADSILQAVKSTVSDGDIILMHDIHQSTVDSLDAVLKYLTEEGYEIVTVSELYGGELLPEQKYFSSDRADSF